MFYVPRLRQFVRKLLVKCVVCRRLNARKFNYPGFADLPDFRTDNSWAFKNVGTDYLGPLSVFPIFNPGEKMFKVWILLCVRQHEG